MDICRGTGVAKLLTSGLKKDDVHGRGRQTIGVSQLFGHSKACVNWTYAHFPANARDEPVYDGHAKPHEFASRNHAPRLPNSNQIAMGPGSNLDTH